MFYLNLMDMISRYSIILPISFIYLFSLGYGKESNERSEPAPNLEGELCPRDMMTYIICHFAALPLFQVLGKPFTSLCQRLVS